MATVPGFRYHPDPVGTGSAEASESPCDLCGELTGLRYVGPVYGREAGEVCLECIADGTAAERLGTPDEPACFTDTGWGVPENVPAAVVDEISHRTPGYIAWQDAHWLYHCGDGAAYLGLAGYEQIRGDDGALRALQDEARRSGLDHSAVQEWISRLSIDGDLTAYRFECLHCGAHLAYADGN